MKSCIHMSFFTSALIVLATAAVPVNVQAAARPAFQMPFPCGQTWNSNTWTGHNPLYAVDLARANGVNSPVVASFGGKVIASTYATNSNYGNYILIDHGGGWKTRYAHLNSRTVGVGANVARGAKIGTVGGTKKKGTGSYAPHLHYEQIEGSAVRKIVWNGSAIPYFAKPNLTSKNCNGSGGTTATGTVRTSGIALNVRSGPTTGYSIVGSLNNGTQVSIYCQINGQSITGTYGTSKIWNRIGTGRYIPDAYTYTGSNGRVAPDC